MFTNSSAPSPRLNFTRFKRSGSIPEAVAVCSCGNNCEGECLAMRMRARNDECQGRRSKSDEDMDVTHCTVCHHPLCTEDNDDSPLLLCRQCDLEIHRQPDYKGHLVLDSGRKRQVVGRVPSPCADDDDVESDSDTQQTVTEDQVDGLFIKHNSKIRNKSPNSELERKLKRKKALKKKNSGSKNEGLDEVLAQLADPENYGMDVDANDNRSHKDPSGRRDSGLGDVLTQGGAVRQDSQESLGEGGGGDGGAGSLTRVPVRRQSRVALQDSHFTLKFGVGADGQREDVEVVAAVHNTTLRDALECVFERRSIDPNSVNVFIEKSKTPLPMSSDTVFLAGNTLEIKEKDEKELDAGQGKQKNNATAKSGANKGNKQSGKSSRRDSVGVVPVLLEPPPTKQRRGSLQLPFREHFFNKGGDSKSGDNLKVYDDSFGSLRGRNRAGNLSIDDTFYPTSSPQGTWTEGKKNKSPKLSVVNLFTPVNKDREKQDQLNEILNRYSANGLPPLPELLALGRPRFDDAILELESHWTRIVAGHQTMTKKQQEHQEAVWELLNTEVSYIRQIRVIIDVFQNCLINVQQESFLNEIEVERLFSNIDKVYECNCLFWEQYLLPVLQYGRETRQALDPLLCKEGFVDHFPNMFQVYFKYFIEHKSCLDYAKSCMENSELFKTFIMWAEAQKQCNRLKMADILVKPMQRLLKYSLLLQAILKHTEVDKKRADIKEMIQSVDKLCWAANNSLQRREDFEKLEAIRKTIDLYDAIEAPNDECAKIIQEYNGNFNLLAPMPGFRDGQPRSLLFQSSLRMREAQNVKLDVDCLLFTDLILICKSNKKMDRFKIIRPPMRLDQLVVSELKDRGSFLLIYMNEYHVPISAFTFHSDVGAIRGWLEKFREAQREFKDKKMLESSELDRLRFSANPAQEEVEYTPLSSVPSDLDLVSSAFPRSESMESADRFIPNLLTPYDGDSAFSELARSGSTGDIQSRPLPLALQRDMIHASTDTKLSAHAGSDYSPAGKRRTGSTSTGGGNLGPKHKPVQSCQSVPNITIGNNNNVPQSGLPSPGKHRNSADNGQFYSIVAEGPETTSSILSVSNQLKDGNRSSSQFSLSEHNNPINPIDEEAKLKLNARRSSRTEKRYHTADSIQDMKHSEKDTSIHKRLSWRTDVQVVDHKNLGSKVMSTDSVRSFPSSSGVSSTGSLHMNLENEISEEVEGNYGGGGGGGSNKTGISAGQGDRRKLFSVGGMEDISDEDGGKKFVDPKSKSTPDLETLFDKSVHVSEMEDGIASVEVSSDGFRKLTHAEILKRMKLKQQILYDANIESSEV